MVLTQSKELIKGTPAPHFSLPDLSGTLISPQDFKDKPLLIVFMCNHCPFVIPKVKELVRIQSSFPSIQVIAINSNDIINYPQDSPQNMILFAQEQTMNFPYLYDESQEVAKAYGAVCTPDPFLFDKAHKLVWQGRISSGGTELGTPELFDVLVEFFSTGTITKPEHKSMGCNIKWKV